MSGLEIPIIKITNQVLNEQEVSKPIIVIVGRVHPWKTYSSFVMHGLIN